MLAATPWVMMVLLLLLTWLLRLAFLLAAPGSWLRVVALLDRKSCLRLPVKRGKFQAGREGEEREWLQRSVHGCKGVQIELREKAGFCRG